MWVLGCVDSGSLWRGRTHCSAQSQRGAQDSGRGGGYHSNERWPFLAKRSDLNCRGHQAFLPAGRCCCGAGSRAAARGGCPGGRAPRMLGVRGPCSRETSPSWLAPRGSHQGRSLQVCPAAMKTVRNLGFSFLFSGRLYRLFISLF